MTREAFHFDALRAADAPEVFGVWGDRESVAFTILTHTPTLAECALRLEKVLASYAKDSWALGPSMLRSRPGRPGEVVHFSRALPPPAYTTLAQSTFR